MKLCGCGCGIKVAENRTFVWGHHTRVSNPMHNPATVLKCAAKHKGHKHTLATKLLISKNRSGILHTEAWKKEMSIRNRGENNPFYREKHSKETSARMKVSRAEQIITEETKELLKRMRNTPEAKAKNSKRVTDLWKNEEYIRKQMKARIDGPNKFEVRALNYLNNIYDNKFVYTGDGDLIINHKSADAYARKLNTVALFHGCYWHLKIKGLEITEKNKRAVEKIDSLPFTSAGYKVIFVWEDEI